MRDHLKASSVVRGGGKLMPADTAVFSDATALCVATYCSRLMGRIEQCGDAATKQLTVCAAAGGAVPLKAWTGSAGGRDNIKSASWRPHCLGYVADRHTWTSNSPAACRVPLHRCHGNSMRPLHARTSALNASHSLVCQSQSAYLSASF